MLFRSKFEYKSQLQPIRLPYLYSEWAHICSASYPKFDVRIENFSAKGERKFIRYVGNYSLNDNNSFTFGFENEEVATSGVDFDTRSIFLLYETLISKNFGFSLGLRGDDRNNLASQETPKITCCKNSLL